MKIYVYDWMRQVLAEAMAPEIHVIQELSDHLEMKEAEIYWISFFRQQGCRLTNLTDGGEGCWGYRHDANARKKISETKRGKTWTDVQRASMVRAKRSIGLEIEEQMIALYRSGKSLEASGAPFGFTGGAVLKALKRHGIERRKPWAWTGKDEVV